MNITRSMHLLAMFAITLDEPTVTQLVLSPFSLFPKVSLVFLKCTVCLSELATKEHTTSDVKFRKFRRQLFHCSLSKILEMLRPGITKYEVVRFGDGHFRRVIYGLGPYIADYEEQVLLTCIVRGWCPRYVIVHLFSQLLKLIIVQMFVFTYQSRRASQLALSASYRCTCRGGYSRCLMGRIWHRR